jgi:2-amino-4-hydroxy-6-hydroxymethyldihydropteridine diphosphokinase
MSLILGTGSNLGDKKENLRLAKEELSKIFNFVAESETYCSPAVDYLDQPSFYNQMLEFDLPTQSPDEIMKKILDIEQGLGRRRDIPKGPRIIDIDIIFWGVETHKTEMVIIPHPAWSQRSFVVNPLQQLPFFHVIKNHFIIPTTFNNSAKLL